jgi:hypothetical protein
MDRELPPLRCGSYRTGHEVHVIQGLRGGNDTDDLPEPATLLEIQDDGTVIIDFGGRLVLWTHDPARLRAITEQFGSISYQPRWSLLWVGRDDHSSTVVSVCDRSEASPCPDRPAPAITDIESLLAHAVDRGGFLLSEDELAAILRHGPEQPDPRR